MNDIGSVQEELLLKYKLLSICFTYIHAHSRKKNSKFITLQPAITLTIFYYITCQLCSSSYKHANINIYELQSFPSLKNIKQPTTKKETSNHQKKKETQEKNQNPRKQTNKQKSKTKPPRKQPTDAF